MRTAPSSFIPDLEAMLLRFQGNLYNMPNEPVQMETHEGAKAVTDLIDYLRTVEPVEAMQWSDAAAMGARDHVLDMAAGAMGHIGHDGSSPFDRLERHGPVSDGNCAESISYGQSDPKEVVIWLAIDDGVVSRGHRLNIMNPAHVAFGCHSGSHAVY